MSLLQAIGLQRSFDGVAALGPLDLEVAKGELVGVLGPSGCGKSTLLRLLAGLDRPDAGSLRFTTPGHTPRIATVFQEPRLMPWLSVAGNVALGLFDLPHRERDARVEAALARVGLGHAAQALPKTLSGGMAQRVGVARALAVLPDLLLMDEPFCALDPLTRMKLQRHLVEILGGGDLSVVFITHDVDEALLLSDRVIVLEGPPGRVRFEHPVSCGRPRRHDEPEIVALRGMLLEQLDPAEGGGPAPTLRVA